jgi:hypothetical protein
MAHIADKDARTALTGVGSVPSSLQQVQGTSVEFRLQRHRVRIVMAAMTATIGP